MTQKCFFRGVKDVEQFLAESGMNIEYEKVEHPVFERDMSVDIMTEEEFLRRLDREDIQKVYLLSVFIENINRCGVNIQTCYIRCYLKQRNSFEEWSNNYKGDTRGFGYPIVRAAWEAGVKHGKSLR